MAFVCGGVDGKGPRFVVSDQFARISPLTPLPPILSDTVDSKRLQPSTTIGIWFLCVLERTGVLETVRTDTHGMSAISEHNGAALDCWQAVTSAFFVGYSGYLVSVYHFLYDDESMSSDLDRFRQSGCCVELGMVRWSFRLVVGSATPFAVILYVPVFAINNQQHLISITSAERNELVKGWFGRIRRIGRHLECMTRQHLMPNGLRHGVTTRYFRLTWLWASALLYLQMN